MRWLRYRIEYLLAVTALWLATVLPWRATLWVARAAAEAGFILMRKRRKIAIENLLATGVAEDRHEAKRIARHSFQSIAETVAESIVIPRLVAKGDDAASLLKVEIDASPETKALMIEPGHGVILVSAHIGNWELAAKMCSRKKQVTGIARRMDNPLVQRLLERRGIRQGMKTIDKHDAHPMKIVRVLKNGETLAILVDQHSPGDNAVTIEFLGLPARSYTTPAVLQRLTRAPIVVGAAIRNGPMDFTLHFSEPLGYGLGRGTGEEDILKATQDMAERLGQYIRKWPEQYLWAHRRWKMPKKS